MDFCLSSKSHSIECLCGDRFGFTMSKPELAGSEDYFLHDRACKELLLSMLEDICHPGRHVFRGTTFRVPISNPHLSCVGVQQPHNEFR
jgi:hypothetical protein